MAACGHDVRSAARHGTRRRDNRLSGVIDGERDLAPHETADRSYELLVARADRETGRIGLTSVPLFPRGSSPGVTTELTVRTEGVERTVFAVVTWAGSAPGLVSIASVPLSPGSHGVQAELRGPGEVRFLAPAGLTPDGRSLAELMAAIPRSLEPVRQAHLICAIEVAGPAARVAGRLDQAEKIIDGLQRELAEPGQFRVSLVAYAGHRPGRRRRNDRVIVTDWLAAPESAMRSVGLLGAADLGYPHAAQVEDMLEEVVRRFGAEPSPELTVLLTIGDRPPYSPVADGEAPACPNRYDWRRCLTRLESRPNVRLAAVRDQLAAPGGTAWGRLGAAALMPLDGVDIDTLGVQTGLVVPPLERMPVPLID